jgi:hypothetical protein
MESPIFSLQKDDSWRQGDTRTASLRHMALGGGMALLALADGKVQRWNMAAGGGGSGAVETVELVGRPADGKLTGLWVDPTGQHGIVALTSSSSGAGHVFHVLLRGGAVATGAKTAKANDIATGALKGAVVESVGWTAAKPGDDIRTTVFLLGTSKGVVFEVRVDASRSTEPAVVLDLRDSTGSGAVASVRWELLPQSPPDKANKFVAFLATVSSTVRFMTSAGGPNAVHVLAGLGPEAAGRRSAFVQEFVLPAAAAADAAGGAGSSGGGAGYGSGAPAAAGGLGDIQLHLTTPSAATAYRPAVEAAERINAATGGGAAGRPTALRPDVLALLTPAGLYTSQLNLAAHASSVALNGAPGSRTGVADSAFLVDPRVVPYPAPSAIPGVSDSSSVYGGGGAGGVSGGSVAVPTPISHAITDYHHLLLFRNRLVALSRITYEAVFEQSLPDDRFGAVKALVVDGAFSSGAVGRDPSRPALWLLTDRGVFALLVRDEERVRRRSSKQEGRGSGAAGDRGEVWRGVG